MRARLRRGLGQRRAKPLPRHFKQSEGADAADLDARPVVLQRLFQPPLDRALVAVLLHIDEIDDDQPGQIAQAQLAPDLVGGFEIGAQRGLFDIALARRAAGIDVDRDQRLGLVDDDVAARAQLRDRRVDRVDLALDLEAVKQPDLRIAIRLYALCMARHQRPHECLGSAVALLAFDLHLVDVARIKIADRALDQIALFVDQGRRGRFERQVADLVPQPQQVFVVALDLGLGPLGTGGADDDAHPLGDLELFEDFLQPPAIAEARDLARDAAAATGIRHQHAVAPSEREIGRQRRALVAALFLGDLHQHDLAALDDLLDLVVADGVAPPPLRVGLLDLFDLIAAECLDGAPHGLRRIAVHRRVGDLGRDDGFLGGAQRNRPRFRTLAADTIGMRLIPQNRGLVAVVRGGFVLGWPSGRRLPVLLPGGERRFRLLVVFRSLRVLGGGLGWWERRAPIGRRRRVGHRRMEILSRFRCRRGFALVALGMFAVVGLRVFAVGRALWGSLFLRRRVLLPRASLRHRHRFGQCRRKRHAGIVAAIRRAAAGRLCRLAVATRPVADRDAVIVRMDFAEGEEAVPVAAIIDKGGLQRRFDPRYLRKVDVAFYLLLGGRLEIELFESVAAEHHHPSLLGVGSVDEHALCHLNETPGRAAAAASRAAAGAVLWDGKPVAFDIGASRNSVIGAAANSPAGGSYDQFARRCDPARRQETCRHGRVVPQHRRAARPVGGFRGCNLPAKTRGHNDFVPSLGAWPEKGGSPPISWPSAPPLPRHWRGYLDRVQPNRPWNGQSVGA